VKFSRGIDGAYLEQTNAFVFAGLPTTNTFTVFLAYLSSASPYNRNKLNFRTQYVFHILFQGGIWTWFQCSLVSFSHVSLAWGELTLIKSSQADMTGKTIEKRTTDRTPKHDKHQWTSTMPYPPSLEIRGPQNNMVTSHTIFSWCNHGNQGCTLLHHFKRNTYYRFSYLLLTIKINSN
jgi:hypothetical protein